MNIYIYSFINNSKKIKKEKNESFKKNYFLNFIYTVAIKNFFYLLHLDLLNFNY